SGCGPDQQRASRRLQTVKNRGQQALADERSNPVRRRFQHKQLRKRGYVCAKILLEPEQEGWPGVTSDLASSFAVLCRATAHRRPPRGFPGNCTLHSVTRRALQGRWAHLCLWARWLIDLRNAKMLIMCLSIGVKPRGRMSEMGHSLQ